jgi:hypothetical protein
VRTWRRHDLPIPCLVDAPGVRSTERALNAQYLSSDLLCQEGNQSLNIIFRSTGIALSSCWCFLHSCCCSHLLQPPQLLLPGWPHRSFALNMFPWHTGVLSLCLASLFSSHSCPGTHAPAACTAPLALLANHFDVCAGAVLQLAMDCHRCVMLFITACAAATMPFLPANLPNDALVMREQPLRATKLVDSCLARKQAGGMRGVSKPCMCAQKSSEEQCALGMLSWPGSPTRASGWVEQGIQEWGEQGQNGVCAQQREGVI